MFVRCCCSDWDEMPACVYHPMQTHIGEKEIKKKKWIGTILMVRWRNYHGVQMKHDSSFCEYENERRAIFRFFYSRFGSFPRHIFIKLMCSWWKSYVIIGIIEIKGFLNWSNLRQHLHRYRMVLWPQAKHTTIARCRTKYVTLRENEEELLPHNTVSTTMQYMVGPTHAGRTAV